jgi:N-acetylmuramoyl-L-alanine amidase
MKERDAGGDSKVGPRNYGMGISRLSMGRFPRYRSGLRPNRSGIPFMKSLSLPAFPLLRVWVPILGLWMVAVAARADDKVHGWQVIEVDGRDYLSVEQIGQFYGLDRLQRDGTKVVLENQKVILKMEVGSPRCLMNGVKFILHLPVTEADGQVLVSRADLSKILDPVLRPNMIGNVGRVGTVILDPAHGGADRGAAGELGSAADYALKIARLAEKEFRDKGFKVVLTRTEDAEVPAEKRLELANAVNDGAVFVGIGFGSAGDEEPGIGTAPLAVPEVPAADDEAVPADFERSSLALASAIHGTALRRLGKNATDRGIQPAPHPGFATLAHPAVFLDAGSLTDPFESRLIDNEQYQKALALAICLGVLKYRNAVGR